MDRVELSFDQAKSWIKDTEGVIQQLLKFSTPLKPGLQKFPQTIKDLSKDVFSLLSERKKALDNTKAAIRHHLLYAETEQAQHNFLFLVLKLYAENCQQLQGLREQKLQAQDLYKHGPKTVTAIIDDSRDMFPNGDVINTVEELATILASLLSSALDYPRLLLEILSLEFGLKPEELNTLLHGNPDYPIPVPFHRFKKQLCRSTGTNTIYSHKLAWQGTQKEFAELILSLESKGWIKSIAPGELTGTVQSLVYSFDLSQTQKGTATDAQRSLTQLLKPSERETKVYTKRYDCKFHNILPNKGKTG
ncbi:hypothetical protein SAMN05444266_107192 [Chitinophaga jiangningensis]|uniref:Uncharacterized protein n=1 Tax=Chitinophaga jiangningensis TaxID=1419482 RepID=A0A1M7HDF9_9BACT|nr:hypothetical protein [Chitinophaga jiangningensis]SHM26515.1 hypothetical protein SAMN05444266_107192 [Chitinophaga jiangningensis]